MKLFRYLLTGSIILCRVTLAVPPGNTNDWVTLPSLTDEFAGAKLNASKWHDHDPGWVGRPPVAFKADCVNLTNGQLRLLAPVQDAGKLPAGFTHRSGFIKARQPVRYGYFEMRAKLLDSTLVSCFWLYNHTATEWTEIDILEAPAGVAEHRKKLFTNAHVFHSPTYSGTATNHLMHSQTWESPVDLTEDFHTYALEWNADFIRWFVDGKMIRELANEHWHQPLFLCINIEANSHFQALPQDDRLPAEYLIDYIRVWQHRKPEPS